MQYWTDAQPRRTRAVPSHWVGRGHSRLTNQWKLPEHMIAGVDPDDDYLDFGYWVQTTEGADDGRHHTWSTLSTAARKHTVTTTSTRRRHSQLCRTCRRALYQAGVQHNWTRRLGGCRQVHCGCGSEGLLRRGLDRDVPCTKLHRRHDYQLPCTTATSSIRRGVPLNTIGRRQ